MSQPPTPKTLMEAVQHFSDEDVCHQYMMWIKWSDGKVKCPHCGSENVGHIKNRYMFQCKDCRPRKQFSTKVGTIFEDSPLPLSKWFVAVWCITNAKNGISSHELARAIGVTQKTSWHMLHRIRLAMQTPSYHKKLEGVTESDESFVGGKSANMHKAKREKRIKGRGTVGKAIVHGILERAKSHNECSKVRALVVPDQKKKTLQSSVKDHVKRGATIYTDSLASYEGLDEEYIHEVIDHAKEYVRGRVHTNGMENFWSLLKRCLGGSYVSVAAWHLYRYLDEEAFRFNERKGSDHTRFRKVMKQVTGRRLQYKELTAATV